MARLAKATGARIVSGLDDITKKDIGQAGLVEERKIEDDKWTYVEGCKNPKAVTIFVRGGTQRVVDEVERSMHDAIMVTKDVLENPGIVGGGGAVEAGAVLSPDEVVERRWKAGSSSPPRSTPKPWRPSRWRWRRTPGSTSSTSRSR